MQHNLQPSISRNLHCGFIFVKTRHAAGQPVRPAWKTWELELAVGIGPCHPGLAAGDVFNTNRGPGHGKALFSANPTGQGRSLLRPDHRARQNRGQKSEDSQGSALPAHRWTSLPLASAWTN